MISKSETEITPKGPEADRITAEAKMSGKFNQNRSEVIGWNCGCADGDKLFMVDITEVREGGRAEVVSCCNNIDHWPSNRQHAHINGGRCTSNLAAAQAVVDKINND